MVFNLSDCWLHGTEIESLVINTVRIMLQTLNKARIMLPFLNILYERWVNNINSNLQIIRSMLLGF